MLRVFWCFRYLGFLSGPVGDLRVDVTETCGYRGVDGQPLTKGCSSMLILTRRLGESLNIGEDVQVTVLEVKGHQVRLGVNAPKKIPVHREEIYERIKREQKGGILHLPRYAKASGA